MSMTNRKRSRWLKRLLFSGVLGAAAYGGSWWMRLPEQAPEFQTAKVARGELAQAVTATGQLSPVVKVQVGSQISGIIQSLSSDFNSPVKAGQVLTQLDPATYQAIVHQAEGYLTSARASLELARVNYQRSQRLEENELVSQSEHDKALADLHQAEAAVKINESNLERARVDLARCTIYSPIDGIVISRNVDVGQTVAASLSAPTLFFIANDLTRMQIEAHVAEADIGRIEVAQDVNFTVDAFPERTFHGKVAQVRNAPTNEQYVVTYETIIEVSNRDAKLKPGMTANVSIVTARRDNAIKIPNAALRWRPPAAVVGKDPALTASAAGAASKKSSKKSEPGSKKDKRKSERTVYVLSVQTDPVSGATNSVPHPLVIKTGITDGNHTEVLEGLQEGQQVLTGMTAAEQSLPLPQMFSLLTGRKK